MKPRRLRELGGVVREVREPEAVAEQVPDLGAVLVDCRHEQVRRALTRELDDQLCKVGLDRPNARALERLVEPDLVGRERLHLHDLLGTFGPDETDHDLVRLRRVARPVNDATGRLDRRFQLDEHRVETGERLVLDGSGGDPQEIPVGHLGNDRRTLTADRSGGVADIRPRARVGERCRRRVREALRPCVPGSGAGDRLQPVSRVASAHDADAFVRPDVPTRETG